MSNLLPESRRTQILDELRLRGMLRVTELSRILGVSPVTVRRDINQLAEEGVLRRVHGGAAVDPEDVAEDLAEEVVDPSRTGHAVGMLVPSLDYYWPEIIQGAQDEAGERGVKLLLRGTSYESTDDRAQVSHLLNSGVDGLILAPDVTTEATAGLLDWLHDAGVPVVLVERETSLRRGHEPLESVNTDHATGAGSAVRYLAELGHTRIGLVTSLGSPHSADIRKGWAEAIAECGLDADVIDDSLDRSDSFSVDPAVARLVQESLDTGVTALLVHADREAIAIVQHCQKRGVRVPEDLSVVAYDDEVAGLFSPPLTAVRPPRNSIGRSAVALIAERLREPRRPTHRVLVSPKLSVRESAAPPRSDGARDAHD